MDTVGAAVDIGTNSVKLIVGRRGDDGAVRVLLDTATITRLGKGVATTGRLDSGAVQRTLDTLAGFAAQARAQGATRFVAVGTSALRDAGESGAQFLIDARTALGGPVEVISGEREARLTYLAARRDPDLNLPPDGPLATSDIGGGSTELVLGIGDEVHQAESLQLGAVRLTERVAPRDPWTDDDLVHAASLADAALSAFTASETVYALVASGGTAANLAGVLRGRRITSADQVHGQGIDAAERDAALRRLAALPLSERRTVPGLEPDRADVIVAGLVIQAAVCRRLGVDRLTVSARGLRYGLLIELLTP
jgi:exopolyphosphatase/guanosine-5'-triphosphate,3'-diphosphate pyrophosphatase